MEWNGWWTASLFFGSTAAILAWSTSLTMMTLVSAALCLASTAMAVRRPPPYARIAR